MQRREVITLLARRRRGRWQREAGSAAAAELAQGGM